MVSRQTVNPSEMLAHQHCMLQSLFTFLRNIIPMNNLPETKTFLSSQKESQEIVTIRTRD